MPLEIRHTLQARRDLKEIWRYIDQTDSSAADRQLRRIAEKVTQLSQVPLIGRSRSEFGEDIRSFVVDRYVVFYDLPPSILRVVRVMHSARNISADAFFDD